MTTFGDRLKSAMDRANISASELAEKTGISKATISRYLSGRFLPKQKRTYLLAKALDVDPAVLMFEAPTPAAEKAPGPQEEEKRRPGAESFASLTPDEQEAMGLYRQLDTGDQQETKDYMEYKLGKEKYKTKESRSAG